MKKQIGWIDIAKGIAIILVVYGHVLDGLNSAGYDIWNYQLIHDIIYSFHMPLFFLLSGIFAKKLLKRDLITILKTRSASLLYPYFLWGTIQAGIMVFLSKYTNGDISIGRLLQLPIRPIGQYWYIYVLFFITLIYYGVCRKLKSPLNQFIVISILFLSSYYISFWEYDRITFHLFYFYLGSEMLNLLENWKEKWRNSIFGSLIVLFIYSMIFYLIGMEKEIATMCGGVLGICLVLGMSLLLSKNIVLELIGRHSLAIYLWHILVISGMRVIYSKILNGISLEIFIILATCSGIIAPLIASQLISNSRLKTIVFGR